MPPRATLVTGFPWLFRGVTLVGKGKGGAKHTPGLKRLETETVETVGRPAPRFGKAENG